MSSSKSTAREFAGGRLANFEDADETTPVISLPPRPRRGAPRDTGTVTVLDETPQVDAPEEAAPTQPAGRSASLPDERIRPSNVHIPVALLEPLTEKCTAEGLSHGEIIIVAVEQAYPRLRDLIHPAATAGGNLFESRRSGTAGRAARSAAGPLTPLNYRLRGTDFATLDHLVQEFGASSRSHLITAALSDYLTNTT